MNSVDIFSVTKSELPFEWVTLSNEGDKVQGTYVNSYDAVDSYGNEQIVYQLLDAAKTKLQNVGIKTSKKPVIDAMAKATYGQIVGFINKGKKQTKDKKSSFTVIEVREDPKFVDQEWLNENKERIARDSSAPKIAPTKPGYMKTEEDKAADDAFEGLTGGTPVDVPFESSSDLLTEINRLAILKLGAKNEEDAKEKVMEATNLAFIKTNYEEIHDILKKI